MQKKEKRKENMCVQATALFSRIFTTCSLEIFTVPAASRSPSRSLPLSLSRSNSLYQTHTLTCTFSPSTLRNWIMTGLQLWLPAEPRSAALQQLNRQITLWEKFSISHSARQPSDTHPWRPSCAQSVVIRPPLGDYVQLNSKYNCLEFNRKRKEPSVFANVLLHSNCQ